MTERSPSLVSTGRREERHTGDAEILAERGAAASPEWPVWVRVSLGVSVLLALMLVVMWGASSTIR